MGVSEHPNALSKAEIAKLVGKPDPLILEIGCNNGADTLEFLETFAKLRRVRPAPSRSGS